MAATTAHMLSLAIQQMYSQFAVECYGTLGCDVTLAAVSPDGLTVYVDNNGGDPAPMPGHNNLFAVHAANGTEA